MCSGGINGILQKVQELQKDIQAQKVRIQAQVVIMVAPLIAGAYAAFALGSVVSGGYHVGKALETRRYWKDYYRNTRRSPRYPYRVGYYDYANTLAMSMYSAGFGMRNVKKLR